MPGPVIRALALVVLICAWSAPGSAVAQDRANPEVPVRLSADEVTYDRELGIVTASGNVEITQDLRTLFADTVTYNQRQSLITASGNLRLLEPSGDVIFGEYMELTDDLRDGVIHSLRMLLKDRSRVAAAGARRSEGTRLDMAKAVYTPCQPCISDPQAAPLWQVKAVRVLHDQDRQTVEYKDAWIEVVGVPVAYTPYLSHPDPTVRRRSGFLTPGFGGSSFLGAALRTPYYWDIAPNKDLTITPVFTTQQNVALIGEYRQLLKTSELKGKTSATVDGNGDFRGHVDFKGRQDIDDTWRWGFDARRATDDLYTRQYSFLPDPSLASRLFAEGFRGRNYFAVNGYAYQGLRATDRQGEIPLVLPLAEYHHLGEPGSAGGRTRLDSSLLALTRNDGTDMRRLSVAPGWDISHVGALGNITKLSLTLQGDFYHVNGQPIPGEPDSFNGVTGRLVPEGALEWRFPFIRPGERVNQVIEPIASVVVSPYGGNPSKIPNEDSREFEFDDTNLFARNRFSGVDRVEGGPRVNYGLKWGAYGAKGGSTTVLVGQTARPKTDDTFPDGSGLDDRLSDIVGRLQVRPGRYVDLLYRTRLDKDNLAANRNEATVTVGNRSLSARLGYVFARGITGSQFATTREELNAGVTSQISRYWRGGFSFVRDLKNDDLRSLAVTAIYEDECLIVNTIGARTFYEDRDLKSDDSIILRIMLKTLGEVKTSVF